MKPGMTKKSIVILTILLGILVIGCSSEDGQEGGAFVARVIDSAALAVADNLEYARVTADTDSLAESTLSDDSMSAQGKR